MAAAYTVGDLIALLAAVAALWGLYQTSLWARHRSHGRGTPLYARARDGRRFAAWSFAAALLLLALGRLTPLGEITLS